MVSWVPVSHAGCSHVHFKLKNSQDDWFIEKFVCMHRVVYCLANKLTLEDIAGLDTSHLCHNSLCVTASHLVIEPHRIACKSSLKGCSGHAPFSDCRLSLALLERDEMVGDTYFFHVVMLILYEAKLRSKTAAAANGKCLLWTGSRCGLEGGLVENYGIIYAKCEKLPGGGLGWKSTTVHSFAYMLKSLYGMQSPNTASLSKLHWDITNGK